jgi:hypothetical protein
VVARHQQERRCESVQQSAQHGVFSVQALLNQVAGDQHDVGLRIEPVQVLDRIGEHAVGVDRVVVRHALGANVQVGDLRQDHRLSFESMRRQMQSTCR